MLPLPRMVGAQPVKTTSSIQVPLGGMCDVCHDTFAVGRRGEATERGRLTWGGLTILGGR
jgi:hypothetical protein